ncbi:hypothetical protein N0V90_004805 [Kalmusia sp. IMI 367209]|nr:hypothetical protein N0V90_004805 [Kalmusia sp. IMI 367209]
MASEARPATTTIPSETSKARPPPTTEPSKPPPSVKGFSLRIYLLRYLAIQAHRLDRLLVRLSTIFASPTSTDALLGTISYTLELLSALLSRLLTYRLTKLATTIVEKADDVLLPGETLIATLPTPPSAQLAAQIATSSKALAGVIADYRIFVRLWGLAGLYIWARGAWNTPLRTEEGRKERVLRGVAWAQIASLVAFQVLENGAYLASKGILTSAGWSGEVGKRREVRWWVWSSRFWAGYVALELLRVGVLHYYESRQSSVSKDEKELIKDGEKEGKLLQQQKKRENWLWWRDLVSNVAYMPMTLHWSVEEEKGFLSDWGVGILGAVAGGSLFVDAWRQTA